MNRTDALKQSHERCNEVRNLFKANKNNSVLVKEATHDEMPAICIKAMDTQRKKEKTMNLLFTFADVKIVSMTSTTMMAVFN